METPITAAAFGVLSVSAAVYAATRPVDVFDSAGFVWAPPLGLTGIIALIGAAEDVSYVRECRAAKERGAEVAEVARRNAEAARRKADARAEAGRRWKRAAAAARANDCATVRELDPQIRALDVELHDVVFARDVAIARCLVVAPAVE